MICHLTQKHAENTRLHESNATNHQEHDECHDEHEEQISRNAIFHRIMETKTIETSNTMPETRLWCQKHETHGSNSTIYDEHDEHNEEHDEHRLSRITIFSLNYDN